MTGGSDGLLELWDYRQREKIGEIPYVSPITCLSYNSESPLKYSLGFSNGLVRVFDLRYEKSVIDFQHQYREPINSIIFHMKLVEWKKAVTNAGYGAEIRVNYVL